MYYFGKSKEIREYQLIRKRASSQLVGLEFDKNGLANNNHWQPNSKKEYFEHVYLNYCAIEQYCSVVIKTNEVTTGTEFDSWTGSAATVRNDRFRIIGSNSSRMSCD